MWDVGDGAVVESPERGKAEGDTTRGVVVLDLNLFGGSSCVLCYSVRDVSLERTESFDKHGPFCRANHNPSRIYINILLHVQDTTS